MKNILFHLVAWVSLFIQIILSFYHMSNYCIISEQSYLKRFWRNLTKLKQKPGHIFRRLRVVVFWGWLGIMWNQIGSGCTNVCFFPPVETVQQWALECNRSIIVILLLVSGLWWVRLVWRLVHTSWKEETVPAHW